jgi:hypothetical protein
MSGQMHQCGIATVTINVLGRDTIVVDAMQTICVAVKTLSSHRPPATTHHEA